MPERRSHSDRRQRHVIPEGLERSRQRRTEDRRDSPRRLVTLDVREPGTPSRSCLGNISVDGASYLAPVAPTGNVLDLMFNLPTFAGPIIARGHVVGRSPTAKGTQVSLVFEDIDVEAQLAIAQWFDETMATPRAPEE